MNRITTALTLAEIAALEAKQQMPTAQTAPQTAPAAAPQQASVTFAASDGRTKTVPLEWPIMVDGKKLESIELRRLTGRDYKALATLPTGADESLALLAVITGLPAEVVESIDADDFELLSAEAKGFLPRSLLAAVEQASTIGAASPH